MRAVQSIDRFVEDHRVRWARLAALVERARGRVARLSADEVLELGALYRSATSDLAVARRDFPRDTVAERSHVARRRGDRKSTRLNSSHSQISYAVFCLKKKNDEK